jgi:hypothetical protein
MPAQFGLMTVTRGLVVEALMKSCDGKEARTQPQFAQLPL